MTAYIDRSYCAIWKAGDEEKETIKRTNRLYRARVFEKRLKQG